MNLIEELCVKETKIIQKEPTVVYNTPFGFSFYSLNHNMYFFNYEGGSWIISQKDLITVLSQLKQKPEKFRTKPESILVLESKTGLKAFRHGIFFGCWQLLKDEQWSAINNPFGLSGPYTNNEDNFEVWFMDNEQEPRSYQTLQEVLDGLKEFKLI
jgi:hypothetical protein